MKRVDWTEHEQDEMLTAAVRIAKENPKMALLAIMKLSQVAVAENRKRNLNAISNLPKYLRDRLVLQGLLDKDWERKRRGYKARLPDPKDAKIAALEAQIKTLNEALAEANTDLKGMDEENNRLLSQPGPLELVEDFFARIIAKGLGMKDDAGKPYGVHGTPIVKIPIPQHERDRRKDPVGFAALQGGSKTKPKFAIVSSFEDIDKAQLHRLVAGAADMRYIDGVNKFGGLGRFNADGGRIILWIDKCPPNWEAELQNMGVSFHRYRGLPALLVQHIKEAAAK